MAVFTSTRQLSQQKKHKSFKKVEGWKADALQMMGYNDDGTKNAFGKYLGGSVGMTIGANVLSSGTDSGEVIASQRESEMNHQMGVVGLIGEIWGMGGSGGGGEGAAASGGANSGAGGAATSGVGTTAASTGKKGVNPSVAGGNNASKVGGGSSQSATSEMFKQSGKSGNSQAQQALSQKLQAQDKDSVMEQMMKDAEGMTAEELLAMEDSYNTGDSENITGEGGNKDLNSAAGATDSIPVAGTAVGLYAEKMAIADAHKAERDKLANRTTSGSEIKRA
jgi:hypothetical protein